MCAVIIGGFSMINYDVYALSCAPPNVTESYEESDVVFVGEVVSKEYLEPSNEHSLIAESLFFIKEPFKGIFQDHVKVSSDEKFWGINFTQGLEYLIFADYFGSEIQSQLCGPTNLIEFSNIDIIRNISEINILSPLKQVSQGIDPVAVKCNEGLVLIIKHNGSPACVRPATAENLEERSWGGMPPPCCKPTDVTLEMEHATSSYMNKVIPTLEDFRNTLSVSQDIDTIFFKFGEPHQDIGSGIHIYVYELNDSTEIWIGYSDHILYVRHVDSGGNFLESLFVENEN